MSREQHEQQADDLFNDTIMCALSEDFEFKTKRDAKHIIKLSIANLRAIDPEDLIALEDD